MAMGWLMGNGFVVIVSPDTFSQFHFAISFYLRRTRGGGFDVIT
jgi:hypothetical protein